MLRESVIEAAKRSDVREAVARLYADLQRQIDLRKPVCNTSGRCCRFDEFGHRLYVTTLELAGFVGLLPLPVPGERVGERGEQRSSVSWRPQAPNPSPLPSPRITVERENSGCPFQIGGLCSVHPIRPFGCRVYFCDATATQWQQEQYERFHRRLKRLHEELGVAYFYVEWRFALSELGVVIRQAASGYPRSLSLPQLRL